MAAAPKDIAGQASSATPSKRRIGYKLSGRWSFSSGSDHCHGVMLGAICGTREVPCRPVSDFRSFLLLGDQYRIDDNWHVAGLKGTGSKDIIVENAFVPDYRSDYDRTGFRVAIDYPLGLWVRKHEQFSSAKSQRIGQPIDQ